MFEAEYDSNGRVVIHFPTRLRLTRGMAGRSATVGGVRFVNGVSDELVDYRAARHLGTTMKVADAYTGVELTGVTYKKTWVASQDTILWGYGQPLHPRVVEREADMAAISPTSPVEGQSDAESTQTAGDTSESSGEASSGPSGEVVNSDDPDAVRARLEELSQQHGTRFLRQLAEARGIEHPGRSTDDVIKNLLASGVQLINLKGV